MIDQASVEISNCVPDVEWADEGSEVMKVLEGGKFVDAGSDLMTNVFTERIVILGSSRFVVFSQARTAVFFEWQAKKCVELYRVECKSDIVGVFPIPETNRQLFVLANGQLSLVEDGKVLEKVKTVLLGAVSKAAAISIDGAMLVLFQQTGKVSYCTISFKEGIEVSAAQDLGAQAIHNAVLVEGRVLLCSPDGRLYSYKLEDGSLLFQHELQPMGVAACVAADRFVSLSPASDGCHLIVRDTRRGNLLRSIIVDIEKPVAMYPTAEGVAIQTAEKTQVLLLQLDAPRKFHAAPSSRLVRDLTEDPEKGLARFQKKWASKAARADLTAQLLAEAVVNPGVVVNTIIVLKAWDAARALLGSAACTAELGARLVNARPLLTWYLVKAEMTSTLLITALRQELRPERLELVLDQLDKALELHFTVSPNDLETVPEIPTLPQILRFLNVFIDATFVNFCKDEGRVARVSELAQEMIRGISAVPKLACSIRGMKFIPAVKGRGTIVSEQICF